MAADIDPDTEARLPLPILDRMNPSSPRPGWSALAPREREGAWDRAVAAFRAAPGSLIEAGPGSIISSVEKIRAFLSEVPHTRLLLDTGHIATWGEDPCDLVDLAGHVQLRQARKGEPQTLEGDVDFPRFLRRLREVGYDGGLSIEYFDLPDWGMPLDDPVGHAVALAEQIRPLL